ncbi:hypothetical protein CAPTEDRAFT_179108 [Capitella teleta]|uniref:Transmembrane protein adipocyte-associated 1 homolog n=1 Tax=Capitella teleta TaxID=283909 RepID=R7V1Z1_CAPTE|nr:hypothetical protein CAPTEDRAFT_179108 [Capitella teleta]|eukprot:ELU09696.1 hypothetical protein CAPTEDRAFT_179108 [Capitella teleta]
MILLPNSFFMFFLLIRLKSTIVKLRRTNSAIFFAFYGMVFLVAAISILRCVVSMTVNAAVTAGDITDKVLWLILRFFLLATELSVLIFGLAFGHLDSQTSIQRVLLVTTLIALLYSTTQGVLEFMYPDDRFHVAHGDREYDIFGHGGMVFWFISSIFFFLVYSLICLIPFSGLRDRFALPTKRSFYAYCGLLAALNFTQSVGSGLLYYHISNGMCVVDVTSFIYFTCFAPLVYGTFLRDFFSSTQPPSILFSYKAQTDEEDVNLPQHSQFKSDANPSFDNTDVSLSPNPLYSHVGINAELSLSADFYDLPSGDLGVSSREMRDVA